MPVKISAGFVILFYRVVTLVMFVGNQLSLSAAQKEVPFLEKCKVWFRNKLFSTIKEPIILQILSQCRTQFVAARPCLVSAIMLLGN